MGYRKHETLYVAVLDVPGDEEALALFEFFRAGGLGEGLSPPGLCVGDLPEGYCDRVTVEIAGAGSVGVKANRAEQIPIPIVAQDADSGGRKIFDSAEWGITPVKEIYIDTTNTEAGTYGACSLYITATAWNE